MAQYAFSASRLPGAAPDRYVESEGDSEGVIRSVKVIMMIMMMLMMMIIRGSYAYLDPNQEWRQV